MNFLPIFTEIILNSQLKAHKRCYNNSNVIRIDGFTKDPESKDYMIVMQYASGGDLHNYLQENFTKFTWKQKLRILLQISEGYLYSIIFLLYL